MPIAQILMVDLLAIVWKVTLVMEQYVKASNVKEKKKRSLEINLENCMNS